LSPTSLFLKTELLIVIQLIQFYQNCSALLNLMINNIVNSPKKLNQDCMIGGSEHPNLTDSNSYDMGDTILSVMKETRNGD